MSIIIQGGPTPVVAAAPEVAKLLKEAEDKRPSVKDVKATTPSEALANYTQRKSAGPETPLGYRVDVEA